MRVWDKKREERDKEKESSNIHSQIHIHTLNCPECNSFRVWKDGLRYIQGHTIQRYLCRSCGFRFSENNYKECQTNNYRQICVLDEKAKNLVAEQKEKVLQENKSNTKSNLINFSWHLIKNGKSKATVETYRRYLSAISKHGDLYDPESVKSVIATKYKDSNTKHLATSAYDSFLKFIGGQWIKPKYKIEHKQVFIPSTEEIQLVLNSGRKDNMIFSLFLYETGARLNEAQRLQWTDLNTERNQVKVKASKHGKERTIAISKKLMDLLFGLEKNRDTVFPKKCKSARQTAFRYRIKNLARKHQNPRLLKIHFHTFRHLKALREYDKTKSILHVKAVLGHKSIMTTQRYVDLYTEIYGDLKPEKCICEIALNVKEAKKLFEQGFKYGTGEYSDGGKLFYKYI